jgi:hypothetical protein
LLFDPALEYKFSELRGKVVRFALDKIRRSVSMGISRQRDIVNEVCNCENRINYDLPCYHILTQHDIIPFSSISNRWRIDLTQYDTGNINNVIILKLEQQLTYANLI